MLDFAGNTSEPDGALQQSNGASSEVVAGAPGPAVVEVRRQNPENMEG